MEIPAQLQEENLRLRKAVEELSILNELSRVISSTMNLDTVIETVVKRSVRAVHGQQGMITLVDEAAPTEMKTLIRAQNSTSDHEQFHIHQNILGWMMINKKALLTNDLANDPRFSGVKVEGDQRSLLCVPLILRSKLIGILAIFNKKDGVAFSEDDQRLLSIIALQSAQILENARLYEQEKSLRTMQEQLRLASQIQLGLLPKTAPKIPCYDIAGKSIPAQAVGGDYFDYIPIDDNRMALTLGDVSGKGLPASLLMANTQATLRGQSLLTSSAKECIARSNMLLCRSTSDEKFVTLFYGILDHKQHKLLFCNAGHDNPYILSSKKPPRRLKTGGVVLSVIEDFPYDEEEVVLEAGDTLVVYSDGLPEAMNPQLELWSDERLGEVLQKNCDLPAEELINVTIAAAKAHAGAYPQSDDMTMIVIKRTS